MVALVMLVAGASADHDGPLTQTQFELIGYSENGRYLAYETYGLVGPEGLARATVHVLDLIERRWVIGSPIEAAASGPGPALAELRRQARDRSRFLIEDLNIQRPAVLAAMVGDGATEADPHSLSFGVPQPDGAPVSAAVQLELAAYNVIASAPCANRMEGSPLGFSLHMHSFGQNAAVYADGPLPRSRDCPNQYRLMAVIVPFEATDMAHAVAIVSMRTITAEGTERGFVPVPLGSSGQAIR